ncbi:FUN14 domain-containing protein 1-like [Halichondria panicea]|uniref:FUN14 domain-containing protein 1-like n=1 Tax=Halichondria panicea TaxID=6063 RepID=UPI00312BBA49
MSEPLESSLLRRLDEEMVEEADEVISSLRIDRALMSNTLNRAMMFAVHTSPVRQFGIGFGVGWLSGYLFRRVSRTAAFLLGCSFIALQGASALGIINVNWGRLSVLAQRRVQRMASNVTSRPSDTPLTQQVVGFCRRHVYITSGFTSGAVIALTF